MRFLDCIMETKHLVVEKHFYLVRPQHLGIIPMSFVQHPNYLRLWNHLVNFFKIFIENQEPSNYYLLKRLMYQQQVKLIHCFIIFRLNQHMFWGSLHFFDFHRKTCNISLDFYRYPHPFFSLKIGPKIHLLYFSMKQ